LCRPKVVSIGKKTSKGMTEQGTNIFGKACRGESFNQMGGSNGRKNYTVKRGGGQERTVHEEKRDQGESETKSKNKEGKDKENCFSIKREKTIKALPSMSPSLGGEEIARDVGVDFRKSFPNPRGKKGTCPRSTGLPSAKERFQSRFPRGGKKVNDSRASCAAWGTHLSSAPVLRERGKGILSQAKMEQGKTWPRKGGGRSQEKSMKKKRRERSVKKKSDGGCGTIRGKKINRSKSLREGKLFRRRIGAGVTVI